MKKEIKNFSCSKTSCKNHKGSTENGKVICAAHNPICIGSTCYSFTIELSPINRT